MNKTDIGFVQNFQVVATMDGQEKRFGENTRWAAIDLAHRVETQGYSVIDILSWDKDTKNYVHDVSDRREKSDGTVIEPRDSMVVLRERYGQKKVAKVDLDTSDAIGKLAAITKTMATQSRNKGVEAPLLQSFLASIFPICRTLGVSSQDIVNYVTESYPELASQPSRQRRQEEHQPA